MSIIRMLTRLTAIAALRGQTWADDRVFDSDNTPLSEKLVQNEEAKPYIVVFTDADNRLEISGTELYGARREMSLVLEIGVASKIIGKEGKAELSTPPTDEGMEIALDMMEDQAVAALFGDPRNDWAELLKDFVLGVERISGQRGASADRARRWAARQVTFVCDTLSDLAPGVPVPKYHPIQSFIKVAKDNPDASMDHAAEICAALVTREGRPEWEQIQAILGLRRRGLRGIGQAPLTEDFTIMQTDTGDDLTDKKGDAPRLREISHDDVQMDGDPAKGLVDMYTIKTNVGTIQKKEEEDTIVIDVDNG